MSNVISICAWATLLDVWPLAVMLTVELGSIALTVNFDCSKLLTSAVYSKIDGSNFGDNFIVPKSIVSMSALLSDDLTTVKT